MTTEELIKTVRLNVAKARVTKRKDYIETRIEWSRRVSKNNWLSRWLWSSPDHEYTPEEAEASFGHGYDSLANTIGWVGSNVLDICDALETAEANNLPLKLTVKKLTY